MAADDDLIIPLMVLSLLNLLGMITMTLLKRVTRIRLDKGQMWTFSLLLSAMEAIALVNWSNGEFFQAALAHLLLGVAAVVLLVLLHFGFHISFAEHLSNDFFAL